MLLAIDVGNTHMQLGVFADDGELVGEWRLSTTAQRTADEYGHMARDLLETAGIDRSTLDAIIVASVVPPLDSVLEKMGNRYFGLDPLMVRADLVSDMPVLYQPPTDVGADRIVNGLAARETHGAPVVVVDFGTATTFDVVDADGAYLGGVIATGVGVSAEALFARAARLPRVDVARPDRVIGGSTVGSVQSGLYYGYADLVDGLLARIREELPAVPKVVATGGWAGTIGPCCKLIDEVDELLTLRGLWLIHQRYAPSSAEEGQ